MKKFINQNLASIVMSAVLGLALTFSMGCGEVEEEDEAISLSEGKGELGDTVIDPLDQGSCYGQCVKDGKTGWKKLDPNRDNWIKKYDPATGGKFAFAPCYCNTESIFSGRDANDKDMVKAIKPMGEGSICKAFFMSMKQMKALSAEYIVDEARGIVRSCEIGLKCLVPTSGLEGGRCSK